MGWDAFGLPAERARDRTGIHPAIITKRNIDNFKRQIKRSASPTTGTARSTRPIPEYYKWTQWIFLQLFERGLAYQAEVPVNWCPARHGARQRGGEGRQVRRDRRPRSSADDEAVDAAITAYAERLLEDLDGLDWPDGTLEMQRNWIGRSRAPRSTSRSTDGRQDAKFTVFTTRPDTLFGATYWCSRPSTRSSTPSRRRAQQRARSPPTSPPSRAAERARPHRPRRRRRPASSPAPTPSTRQRRAIPIWIADYVLAGYGTGAIMAVPGHDERDHAFARSSACRSSRS
jgi:leucyl-tRNA synthetase